MVLFVGVLVFRSPTLSGLRAPDLCRLLEHIMLRTPRVPGIFRGFVSLALMSPELEVVDIHVCIYIHIFINLFIYLFICLFIYVYIYMYAYVYICIYTHTFAIYSFILHTLCTLDGDIHVGNVSLLPEPGNPSLSRRRSTRLLPNACLWRPRRSFV